MGDKKAKEVSNWIYLAVLGTDWMELLATVVVVSAAL